MGPLQTTQAVRPHLSFTVRAGFVEADVYVTTQREEATSAIL